jgi:CRP/FNR family cyclic AMP-dependent transcriptional regulator
VGDAEENDLPEAGLPSLRAGVSGSRVANSPTVKQWGSPSPPSTLSQPPPSHLSRMMMAGKPVRLSRGEVLFQTGATADSCYWIRNGTLKVAVSSETGQERILALLGSGSVVGESAMLNHLPHSATVTAVSNADLTELKRYALAAYLSQHAEVYADLIAILVGRLRKAEEELAAHSFLASQTRIARAVLGLVDQIGEKTETDIYTLPHTVSHSDIGAMSGVARESVSRTISEWRRRGIVTRVPGSKMLRVNRRRLGA